MNDPLAHLRRDVTRQALALIRTAEKHDAALRTVAESSRDPLMKRSAVDASRHLGAFILSVRGSLVAHGLFDVPLDPSGTAVPARRASSALPTRTT